MNAFLGRNGSCSDEIILAMFDWNKVERFSVEWPLACSLLNKRVVILRKSFSSVFCR